MLTRKVRCPCGALNRVGVYWVSRRPKCGACGVLLPEPTAIRAFRYILHSRVIPLAVGAALIVVAWRPLTLITHSTPQATVGPGPMPLRIELPRATVPADRDCSVEPQPATGIYQSYSHARAIAPLTIRTAAGSNYLVKMQDAGGGADIVSFFIRGGQDLQTQMPLGSFVLKYATGQFWCGDSDLFGRDTGVSRARDALRFYQNESGTVGKTIELIPQVGGNLETYSIPRSQF
jgi:hypothetical protein